MTEIIKHLDVEFQNTLQNAAEVWIAVAMINGGGLKYFRNLPEKVKQHHLVGIDLPTPTTILEELRALCSDSFSAKVRESDYYFHPKVYIIRDENGDYTAIVGSSNATNGGLKNNIELNVKITDEKSCKDLINWYWEMDRDAILITQELIDEHRKRYEAIKQHEKNKKKETKSIKSVIHRSDGQFFTTEHHEVFRKEYQTKNSDELKKVRVSVRERLVKLHKRIYPKFQTYGLNELFENQRDPTSRHYINAFSGKTIASLWLHYGKSQAQMLKYANDKENKSFINHVRMQVIIHSGDLGIWLVLGKNGGSKIDRDSFRERMTNNSQKNKLLTLIQNLSPDYWIRSTLPKPTKVSEVKKNIDLDRVLQSEHTREYFIIGRTYEKLDPAISDQNIDHTVLSEFEKLYPIYRLMNAELQVD